MIRLLGKAAFFLHLPDIRKGKITAKFQSLNRVLADVSGRSRNGPQESGKSFLSLFSSLSRLLRYTDEGGFERVKDG